MNLVDQIKALHPSITDNDFRSNIVLVDLSDGNGPFIKEWNMPDLEEPTKEEIADIVVVPDVQKIVVDFVQERLDEFARTRSYDNILSACTYANSSVPKFKEEGLYCVDTRDAHWNICYKILNDVLAGERSLPTLDEVVKELPELVWPN